MKQMYGISHQQCNPGQSSLNLAAPRTFRSYCVVYSILYHRLLANSTHSVAAAHSSAVFGRPTLLIWSLISVWRLSAWCLATVDRFSWSALLFLLLSTHFSGYCFYYYALSHTPPTQNLLTHILLGANTLVTGVSSTLSMKRTLHVKIDPERTYTLS